MTVILLSVCFIKTCTNPVLLILDLDLDNNCQSPDGYFGNGRGFIISFYRSIVELLNSLE